MSEHITERKFEKLVAKEAGLTIEETVRVTEAMERVINLAHADDKPVHIRGLGAFRVVELKARTFHNPKTLQLEVSKPKKTIRFKVAKLIEEQLNENHPLGAATAANPL